MNDEQALDILDKTEFKSLQDAGKWLCQTTDLRMLRESFDHEGFKVNIESNQENKSNKNLARWNLSDAIEIKEIEKDKESINYKILKLAQSLQFIDEFKLPVKKRIKTILIHGGPEFALQERVRFVVKHLNKRKLSSKQPFLIFYGTSPRLIFNNEASLAEILASDSCLNVPGKAEEIKKVLNESKENWLNNGLDILKQKILTAVGLEKWPTFIKSRYNEEPEIYERSAKDSGVTISIKDWPVAMDLTDYLFKKEIEKYPRLKKSLAKNQVILFPAVFEGKPGKLTTTEDVVHGWHKKNGEALLLKQKGKKLKLAVIIDNMTHDILRQGEITQEALKQYSLLYKVYLGGSAANQFSPKLTFDALTKYCYMRIDFMLRNLNHTKEKTESLENKKQSDESLKISAKALSSGTGLYSAPSKPTEKECELLTTKTLNIQ